MKKAIDFIIWTIIIIILSFLLSSKPFSIMSMFSGDERPHYDKNVEVLKPPKIMHPTSAITRGAQGQVMLKFLVRTDGSVHSVTVDRSSGHADLDSAAVAGLKFATFKPAMNNGKLVESVQKIPITFRRR